jgi:hypothetical protein
MSIITKDEGLVALFTVTEGVGVNLGEARDQGLRFSLALASRHRRYRFSLRECEASFSLRECEASFSLRE